MKKKPLYIFLHIPKTGGSTFSVHLMENLHQEDFLNTTQLRYKFDLRKVNSLDKNKIKVILGHASYYGIHKLFKNREPKYIIFLRDSAERIVSSYNFEMRVMKSENISFWKWYKTQPKNELVDFLDMKFKGKKGSKLNLPDKIIPILNFFIRPKNYLFFKKIYRLLKKIQEISKNKQKQKFENAKKLIDKCWYVGFIPRLDNDLKFLFKKIGVPVKYKNKNVTHKSKKLFELDNKTRKKLYKDNNYDKQLVEYAKKKFVG